MRLKRLHLLTKLPEHTLQFFLLNLSDILEHKPTASGSTELDLAEYVVQGSAAHRESDQLDPELVCLDLEDVGVGDSWSLILSVMQNNWPFYSSSCHGIQIPSDILPSEHLTELKLVQSVLA